MPRLIDLAQPRRLALSSPRRRLIIAPISERAWFECYYDKIFAILRCGPRAEVCTDVESAAINLLKEVAISSEGYPHLFGTADWLQKIPIRDMSTYGNALLEVFENRESPEAAAVGLDPACAVRMEALWGSMSSEAMCRHRHLVHQFERPSKQQRNDFRNASTRVRRTAGVTRRGPAVFLAPEQSITAPALAALYDELILRVDGYAVNGEPLTDDREKIAANMDTFHKVKATRWLFSRVMSEAKGWRAA